MAEVINIRRQHNVGQGGFHSAFVQATLNSGVFRYDYVYDCGALSYGKRTTALGRQLKAYRPRPTANGQYVVDALVLSHYDRDHMNGAEELVKLCQVDQIFLPALTPELLGLEIARQSSELSQTHISDLFAAAYSETLWGCPIVRISRGGPGDGDGPPNEPDLPVHPLERAGRTTEGSHPTHFPAPLTAVDASTGAPLRRTFDHEVNVQLKAHTVPVWRFKFWNQNISEELTVLILTALDQIGFPLMALEDVNGAKTIVNWLASKTNRDSLIDAYRFAYEEYEDMILTGVARTGFANYVSMIMFSGPIANASVHALRTTGPEAPMAAPVCPWNCEFEWAATRSVGWMGTGDAMLGEPQVWSEFEEHFKDELPATSTILLPHHGAAPKFGARFYHPELSSGGRINVLSYGARNSYGHPASSVIDQILIASARHVAVTEQNSYPYCELVRCNLI